MAVNALSIRTRSSTFHAHTLTHIRTGQRQIWGFAAAAGLLRAQDVRQRYARAARTHASTHAPHSTAPQRCCCSDCICGDRAHVKGSPAGFSTRAACSAPVRAELECAKFWPAHTRARRKRDGLGPQRNEMSLRGWRFCRFRARARGSRFVAHEADRRMFCL